MVKRTASKNYIGIDGVFDEITYLFHTGNVFAHSKDLPSMFQSVLERVMYASGAEGGSLYLYDKASDKLKIVVMENSVLNIHQAVEKFDPIKINGFIELPVCDEAGNPFLARPSVRAFSNKEVVFVPDVYAPADELGGLEFSQTYEFDKTHGYKTRNILVFPIVGINRQVLGVCQLINCNINLLNRTSKSFFDVIIWQIGMLLSNALLINELEVLLTSLVEMVVKAIDEKSAYTAGHCHRVTELTVQLAEEMCKATTGPYANFNLSPAEKRELRMSALLHDIGKIVTPMHVMEKETKLYSLNDRVEIIEEQLAKWQMAQRVKQLESFIAEKGWGKELKQIKTPSIAEEVEFINQVNRGEVFIADKAHAERLDNIAKRTITLPDGQSKKVMSQADYDNLKITKGTLNDKEWEIMRDHVSISIRLLSSIPWPQGLKNVVKYAGSHHENLDGSGYPNNLKREDMSLPELILGFADRFEGMSAPDRPYRKVKMTLGRAMQIMGAMVEDGHIDKDMYEFFKQKKLHLKYAKKYLPPELIDDD